MYYLYVSFEGHIGENPICSYTQWFPFVWLSGDLNNHKSPEHLYLLYRSVVIRLSSLSNVWYVCGCGGQTADNKSCLKSMWMNKQRLSVVSALAVCLMSLTAVLSDSGCDWSRQQECRVLSQSYCRTTQCGCTVVISWKTGAWEESARAPGFPSHCQCNSTVKYCTVGLLNATLQ